MPSEGVSRDPTGCFFFSPPLKRNNKRFFSPAWPVFQNGSDRGRIRQPEKHSIDDGRPETPTHAAPIHHFISYQLHFEAASPPICIILIGQYSFLGSHWFKRHLLFSGHCLTNFPERNDPYLCILCLMYICIYKQKNKKNNKRIKCAADDSNRSANLPSRSRTVGLRVMKRCLRSNSPTSCLWLSSMCADSCTALIWCWNMVKPLRGAPTGTPAVANGPGT